MGAGCRGHWPLRLEIRERYSKREESLEICSQLDVRRTGARSPVSVGGGSGAWCAGWLEGLGGIAGKSVCRLDGSCRAT